MALIPSADNAQADLGLRCPLTERILLYMSTDREFSDQTAAHMRMLIYTYVISKLHKGPFPALRIYLSFLFFIYTIF